MRRIQDFISPVWEIALDGCKFSEVRHYYFGHGSNLSRGPIYRFTPPFPTPTPTRLLTLFFKNKNADVEGPGRPARDGGLRGGVQNVRCPHAPSVVYREATPAGDGHEGGRRAGDAKGQGGVGRGESGGVVRAGGFVGRLVHPRRIKQEKKKRPPLRKEEGIDSFN